MASRITGSVVIAVIAATLASFTQLAQAQNLASLVFPEQKTIAVRDPAELPATPIPMIPPPPTVAEWGTELEPRLMTLDEAIRLALANSTVVRVLAGVTAVSSGKTIYDTAAANTRIDQERAQFDPRVQVQNSFNRIDSPGASSIRSIRSRQPSVDCARMITGWTSVLPSRPSPVATSTWESTRFPVSSTNLAAHPETRSSLTMDYTQPLLQGGGDRGERRPDRAGPDRYGTVFLPIQGQRAESGAERDRGLLGLVSARTDLWIRDQQVKQLEQSYQRTEAQFRLGIISNSIFAQLKVSLASFTAARIAARGTVLQREAALRNVLGLPPSDLAEIIPTTPPLRERVEMAWEPLVMLAWDGAGHHRAEADPRGRRAGAIAGSQSGVAQPGRRSTLSLERPRRGIAQRQSHRVPPGPVHRLVTGRQLLCADWAEGGARSTAAAGIEIVARSRQSRTRYASDSAPTGAEPAQSGKLFEQYEAFAEMRVAARANLEQQLAEYRVQRIIFLNVLLAITDWGNAVSNEAQSLLQYNSELANLELQTGTILETHGVRFFEERFGRSAPGPLRSAGAYP